MFEFQELQASGILLCFVPLILTVGGFIAFAVWTDRISTATYLRRLDPRPETERTDTPVPIQQKVRAVTPSGLAVTVLPGEGVGAARSANVEDLLRIEGIGPKIKAALMAAGVSSFSQLAAMTPDAIKNILNEAKISNYNDPTTWPEQAALAARGKWDELQKLQDELDGGKRV